MTIGLADLFITSADNTVSPLTIATHAKKKTFTFQSDDFLKTDTEFDASTIKKKLKS